MKKTLLISAFKISAIILISILFSGNIFSQDFDLRENKKKHQISIGVADFLKNDIDPWYPIYGCYDYAYFYPYPYYSVNQPKIILKYKYSLGNVALRAGTDFYYRNNESETGDTNLDNEYSNLYTLNKIGCEWQQDFKRVQLVFGADLFLQYGLDKSEYESFNYYYDENGNYFETIVNSVSKNTTVEYGISPFIGMNVFINENFSLGVETNYLVGKYKNTYKYEYGDIDESESSNEGSFARYGQIGTISFNVHF